MGYVRLNGIFPYTSFPDRRHRPPLHHRWRGPSTSVRCAACRQPDGGELLDPVSMAEVAVIQTLDASALHRASSAAAAQTAVETYGADSARPGGCVGGFWRVYLALD